MRYNIIGKGINVSDTLRTKVSEKIDRISRLFTDDTNVSVTLSQEKQTYKAEVTVPLKKRVLRAESKDFDLMAAIDAVVDIVEKQTIKYKNRLRDRSRHDNRFKEEFVQAFTHTEFDEKHDESPKIERVKKFDVKPMEDEDAVMELELSGHNFFVFRNRTTNGVNVVYKRKNGSYGLIESE